MSCARVLGASWASFEALDCIPGGLQAMAGGGTVDVMSACAWASRVEVTRRPKDPQANSVELPSTVEQSNGAIRRSGKLSRRGEMPLHCQVHAY